MNTATYLHELKKRLGAFVVTFIIIVTICIIFSNQLYLFIARPALKLLPENAMLVSTTVTGGFMIPITLAIYSALFISFPFFCYQAWRFVAPGLYQQEKSQLLPLLFYSNLLFYLGIIFALYFIAPLALQFFLNAAPDKVTLMLEIASYLDFILKIAFGAAIVFQIPLLLVLLIRFKVVTIQQLKSFRRYFIVLALIIGMLCTPPDVISQLMLAIPLIVCYELIILFGKKMPR